MASQDKRIYSWESSWLRDYDKNMIKSHDEVESIVNYVWAEMGLTHPPRVTANYGHRSSTGFRNEISININMRYTWVVLHELAHAMTHDPDMGKVYPDPHGPEFMKVYVDLLVKFLNMNLCILLHSLKQCNIKVYGYLQ